VWRRTALAIPPWAFARSHVCEGATPMATCSSWAWQCRVVTNLPVASCDVTSCCSLFRVWRNAHCRRSAAAFTLSSLEARCGWSDCELSGGETCNPRRLPLANRPLLAPTCDGTARTICSPKRPKVKSDRRWAILAGRRQAEVQGSGLDRSSSRRGQGGQAMI
jgi:hypothetical protein